MSAFRIQLAARDTAAFVPGERETDGTNPERHITTVLTLQDQQYTFPLHLLTTNSEFFRNLVKMNRCYPSAVCLDGYELQPDIFKKCLNFLHASSIMITPSNWKALLHAATVLGIPDLAKTVTETIMRNVLDPKNCCWFLIQCSEIDIAKCSANLIQEARAMLATEFDTASKTPEFLELSVEEIVELLTTPKLLVASEVRVFKSAMLWCEARFTNKVITERTLYSEAVHKLDRVLDCIRFGLIPLNVLGVLPAEATRTAFRSNKFDYIILAALRRTGPAPKPGLQDVSACSAAARVLELELRAEGTTFTKRRELEGTEMAWRLQNTEDTKRWYYDQRKQDVVDVEVNKPTVLFGASVYCNATQTSVVQINVYDVTANANGGRPVSILPDGRQQTYFVEANHPLSQSEPEPGLANQTSSHARTYRSIQPPSRVATGFHGNAGHSPTHITCLIFTGNAFPVLLPNRRYRLWLYIRGAHSDCGIATTHTVEAGGVTMTFHDVPQTPAEEYSGTNATGGQFPILHIREKAAEKQGRRWIVDVPERPDLPDVSV